MHERQPRERRSGWQQNRAKRFFRKVDLQLIERDRLVDTEVAHTRASQLSQVRANVQTFSKVFCESSDVRARRTGNSSVKVEGAVMVVLDEVALRFHRFKLMNTNTLWLPFYALT